MSSDSPAAASQPVEAETTPDETSHRQRLAIPSAVAPRPVPDGAELDHPTLYFNRELGWIDFNWRVLYQALDERLPLLERVRFVAITASNLDEFVQKRVGGLKRQDLAGVRKLSPDGRSPAEQLELIRQALLQMHRVLTDTWENKLQPALEQQAKLHIYHYTDLNPAQREQLDDYFHQQIYPVLTPLAVDPGRPFPFISNLSLSLAVLLKKPRHEHLHFARLKVPTNLDRWLSVPTEDDSLAFLPVEDLIIRHIQTLFQGMELVAVHPFRITRNADLARDEEEADDLLSMISEELRERRFAPVVRLELNPDMPPISARFCGGSWA